MKHAASVLIYDPTDGGSEALATLLERDGLRTIVTSEVDDLRPLFDLHQPAVLLLDIDRATSRDVGSLLEISEFAARSDAPIVALGTRRGKSPLSGVGEFVRKPYHYGPLVHRIMDAVSGRGGVASWAA